MQLSGGYKGDGDGNAQASFEVGAQRDHPSSYQGGSPPYIRELYASTPTHVDDYGVKNPESRVVLNAKSRIAAAKRSSPSNRRCDKRYEMLGMIQIKNSRPIASLVVQPTVANSSVDQNQTKKLLVDASESTQTPFLLVSSDGSCYSTGQSEELVNLMAFRYNNATGHSDMYCLTHNPGSGTSLSLTVDPCVAKSESTPQCNHIGSVEAVNGTEASPSCTSYSQSNSIQSQIFSYDSISGQIRPISSLSDCSDAHDSLEFTESPEDSQKVPQNMEIFTEEAQDAFDDDHSTCEDSSDDLATAIDFQPSTLTDADSVPSKHAPDAALIFVALLPEIPGSSLPLSSPSASGSVTQAVYAAYTSIVSSTVLTETAPTPSSYGVTSVAMSTTSGKASTSTSQILLFDQSIASASSSSPSTTSTTNPSIAVAGTAATPVSSSSPITNPTQLEEAEVTLWVAQAKVSTATAG